MPSWGPLAASRFPGVTAWCARDGSRPGTQDWSALRISTIERRVDIQSSLRAVREDQVKYVDASAVLRVLFVEPGPSVTLLAGDHVVSSRLMEVEAFRAVDRERLLGNLSDAETAIKRKELTELLAMTDLAPVDDTVIDQAKSSFVVNLRAIDAIHVATAELLAAAAEGEPLEFWTHDERQATAAIFARADRPRRRSRRSRLTALGAA